MTEAVTPRERIAACHAVAARPSAEEVERARRAELAASFRLDLRLETVLRWRDAGDVRYERLDLSTRLAAAHYAEAKAAHAAEQEEKHRGG